MDELIIAALRALPLGVIVVDTEGRVVMWNEPAEEFIASVGRPTLCEGMTLESAHTEKSRAGMVAMVRALREGRRFPHKRVVGNEGRIYHVAYHGLFSGSGTFLGIAQVITDAGESAEEMPLPEICDRRSIRLFEQREVSRDLIDEMLEAARLAPSAGNIQSFRALVVSEPSELASCRSAAYGIGACATAPLIFVCMADVTAAEHIGERSSELHAAGALEPVDIMALRSGDGRPFELKLGSDIALVNAAIAAEHMVLQATAHGLGTCWVHHFDNDQLRREFDIPVHFEFLSLVAVGWPAEHPNPRPRLEAVEWKRP